MSTLEYLRELNIHSMMLRVLLAMLVGGAVGFEREKKGRPAGFRTYMLVALGAALTVILSQYFCVRFETDWADVAQELGVTTDASRFAAQVINGVGFLGAGTIIVTGQQEVKGLTTAACLWASACIGIAIGAGFYECVVIGFILIVVSLKLLPRVENFIMAKSVNMAVYVEMDNIENLGAVVSRMRKKNVRIYDVDIDKQQHENISQVNALFNIRLPKRSDHTELLAELSMLDGIISIEEV